MIGAYWYSRPETLKQCTEKLLDFLIKLKEHNPSYFGNWFELGYSKNEALKHHVELNYDYIKKRLSKKNGEDDLPKTSFSVGFWDGKSENSAVTSLSASLGSDESEYYTNNCIIKLPFDATKNEYYNNSKTNQEALLNLMKKSWHPEWISINGIKCNNLADI